MKVEVFIFFSHPDFVLYSTVAMKAAFLHLSFLFLFLNSSPYGPDTSYSVWSSQGLLANPSSLALMGKVCLHFLELTGQGVVTSRALGPSVYQ